MVSVIVLVVPLAVTVTFVYVVVQLKVLSFVVKLVMYEFKSIFKVLPLQLLRGLEVATATGSGFTVIVTVKSLPRQLLALVGVTV